MAEEKNKGKQDNDGQVTETPDGDMVVRTVGRDFRVEGNDVDGYIGVSSEYRTYANPTERPYVTAEEVDILVRADLPTDVERMTLDNAAQTPKEAVDDEESDTHPSKVLEEKGAADDDEKSTKDIADAQGQGKTPADPVSADTKNAGGQSATGSSTRSASTASAGGSTKAGEKATENKPK